MARHIGLFLAAAFVGTMAPNVRADLVFHVDFETVDGSNNPIGTYLGNPLTGTLDGTAAYGSTANPFAPAGSQSLQIGSDTSKARFVPSTSLNTINFNSGTVAAWVNMTSFTTANGHRIFSTRGSTNAEGNSTNSAVSGAFDFYIYRPNFSDKPGWLELHAGIGSSGTQFNPGGETWAFQSPDDLGEWFFVAATWQWDGDAELTTVDFYVGDESGTLAHIGSATNASAISPGQHANSDIRVGGYASNASSMRGYVDEFWLYNNHSTQSELQSLMIPEPASMSLIGIAMLPLIRRMRRNRV